MPKSELDISGRSVSPSIVEGGVQAAPPELQALIGDLLGVPRQMMSFFGDNFGEILSAEEIYTNGIGLPLIDGWRNHLGINIFRARKSLQSEVIYHFSGTDWYMLDQRKNGSFVPDFRLNFVNSVKPEVHPIIEYFNKVDVEGDQLVSRLTPTELGVLNHLGSRFSDLVSSDEIIQKVWGDRDGVIINDEDEWLYESPLWITVSRLRKAIRQFDDGVFDLVCKKEVGYGLASVGG